MSSSSENFGFNTAGGAAAAANDGIRDHHSSTEPSGTTGASSLVGLFAPPSPPSTNTSNSTSSANASDTTTAATPLAALFAPPRPPTEFSSGFAQTGQTSEPQKYEKPNSGNEKNDSVTPSSSSCPAPAKAIMTATTGQNDNQHQKEDTQIEAASTRISENRVTTEPSSLTQQQAQVSPNSSSLQSLFAGPPPITSNKKYTDNAAATSSSSKSLQSLFAPTPPTAAPQQSTNSTAQNNDDFQRTSSEETPLLFSQQQQQLSNRGAAFLKALQESSGDDGDDDNNNDNDNSINSSFRMNEEFRSMHSFLRGSDRGSFDASTATPRVKLLSRKQQQQQQATPVHANNYNSSTDPILGRQHAKTASALPAIREVMIDVNTGKPKLPTRQERANDAKQHTKQWVKYACSEMTKSTTWVGAFMFLLYQIVFCLTMGSAITRPHGTSSMLGLMTKMAASGIIVSAAVFWFSLSDDIPALYPTVDLFTAPFLANIAVIVDETLYNDPTIESQQDNDQYFLGSFTMLAAIALYGSATLLGLASVFKLANLGAFLPSAVLSGFFAAVGVLTWTLGFKVDSGKNIGTVLFSGDWDLMRHSILHHLPSVIAASFMKHLGPKNPAYVVLVIFATVAAFYAYMVVFSVSMDEMIESGWFWSKSDFVHKEMDRPVGFAIWAPPVPLGWINSLFCGRVHWGAIKNGMPTTLALSFLYMIRCSLHGAALKKNVPNLQRTIKVKQAQQPQETDFGAGAAAAASKQQRHRRDFSEAVDIETFAAPQSPTRNGAGAAGAAPIKEKKEVEIAKPTNHSIKDILTNYAYSQYICATIGSFGITPSVAVSTTMYTLGAENVAPQVGSVVFLIMFFLSNFTLVSYIPKPAFSSLLVLAFIDMTDTWFIKSYFKTREKGEWIVVPLIVILAFAVDLLSAVFLGIAMSTFFFVASFYQSGVVKFVATGITIRSTIERPLNRARWLDQHGDYIQILVLQNYLFFGNASSILSYITSMFDDPAEEIDPVFLPPLPKVVILDFALVSGMDRSAVDVIGDILSVCGNHDCKLFFSGLSLPMRQTMMLGGIKPGSDIDRKQRKLRLFADLDTAIGKAEDFLLLDEAFDFDVSFASLGKGSRGGFRLCLRYIDEQHGTNYETELSDLDEYAQMVEMQPEEVLYEDLALDRGLFFIEEGLLKIERQASYTLSRVGTGNTFRGVKPCNRSLNGLNARSGTIGRELAQVKQGRADPNMQTFRVARIGPGWVIGSIEAISGMASPGLTIAVTQCRMHYISYKKIEELEHENPVLVLKLYKFLSFIMAKRQEITIGHLATLHSIMGSPAQKRPLTRTEAQAFSNTFANMG